MIKNEFLRYSTSRFNILLVILITIPVIISYYFTNMQKSSWEEQITSVPPPADLDVVSAIIYVEKGYNGMAYISNFLFSDAYIIFVIMILIGFGIHIGAVTYRNLQSNFGAMIVSKIGYKKYIYSLLFAQLLYVLAFISGYFIVLFLLSFLIWGGYHDEVIASVLPFTNGIEHFILMLSHISLLIVYVSLITLITSLLTNFIKNRYTLQIMPFLLYLIPYALFSIANSFWEGTWYFISDNYLLSIYYYLATDASIQSKIFAMAALPLLLATILATMFIHNVRKYEKSYLL